MHPYQDNSLATTDRVADLVSRMTLAEKVGQCMQLDAQGDLEDLVTRQNVGSLLHIPPDRMAHAIELAAATRLGIPLLLADDCIHGHSFWPGATIFGTQLAVACSWRPENARRMARITAVEATSTGFKWTFSPVLCIARDLRWGRVDETFGEDPFLIGEFASAMVAGYQGNDLRDKTAMLATAKHFAGYSETQGGRDASEADVSRRKLLSWFTPPFERVAREGSGTFMLGYQAIDGQPVTVNSWLLNDVLRGAWGYTGVLVTDWDNVGRMVWEQQICADYTEAAARAMNAGNDMTMTTPQFYDGAQEAVRRGLLEESTLDAAVGRILACKFDLGLFENPGGPDMERQRAVIGCDEHRRTNLENARESLVLLVNDGALPITAPSGTIAVIGPNADDRATQLGDWAGGSGQCSWLGPDYVPQGVVTVLDGVRQVAATHGWQVTHATGCGIATMSGSWGVGEDGQPQVLPPARGKTSALIEAFNPGDMGGQAIAELIFGDIEPSGRLPISFPVHAGQQPVYYNQIRGQHGDRYADLTQEPTFAFGQGLSYSRVEYSDLQLDAATVDVDETIRASVRVANTGDRVLTETVQWYVRDLVTSVTWADKELKSFQKVTLTPGESAAVSVELAATACSVVDSHAARVVEPGEFELLVGSDSRNASLLTTRFTVVA